MSTLLLKDWSKISLILLSIIVSILRLAQIVWAQRFQKVQKIRFLYWEEHSLMEYSNTVYLRDVG